MKFLVNICVFFAASSIASLTAADIGEGDALVRFSAYSKALIKDLFRSTFVPVGRENFPLNVDIKRRFFGLKGVVTVDEYRAKIKSLEDVLENANLTRPLLREDEKNLRAQQKWQTDQDLDKTEKDLEETIANIGRATFIIHNYPLFIKALEDAYIQKKYSEVIDRKMRRDFMQYVSRQDLNFFNASLAHHQNILEHLLP